MKIKRIIAGVLLGVMLVTMFSGCAKSTSTGEKVVLKYVMPGPGKQEDSDKVWAAFNEKLQQKLPNVEVQFEIIPLAEYKNKFMLMNSAREQIDIASNYGLDFGTEVSNGTFAELNKLLDNYGSDVKAALPEWLFGYMTVNDKIYGIPSYQMVGSFRCINFFKEQADKYLDVEKFKKALYSSNTFTQEVYDILEKYMADMKADGLKFKTASLLNSRGYENIVGTYRVVIGDESCKVINGDFSEPEVLRYKTAREWYQKGYIREDSLSAKDNNNYIGKIDGYPFWDSVWTKFSQVNDSKKYGQELIQIPYYDNYFIGSQNSAMGTSIMASSKYQKEAMQVLNLIQSDKELYNLLVYGIEGDHYTKVGDDRIVTVAEKGQGTANDRYGIYKWIVGNTELAYDHQLEPEGYKNWVFEEANKTEWRSPLIGFIPNTTNISDIITQVSAIRDEYSAVLWSGSVENWEQLYEEWKNKVKMAGDDKAIEELQSQINEFLNSKK